MRVAAQVFLAYVLLLVVGAVWRLLPMSHFVPDLVALFAAYLGLSARSELAPSVAGAVVIGYLADLLFGSPTGLLALTAGLVCTICHLIQGRLLVRGRVFTAVFGALASVVAGLIIVIIRLTSGLLGGGFGIAVTAIFSTAILTGILAPFVFRACRFVDSKFARTHRERDAAASGVMF